ncbi:MAG TPA: 7-cyano-7-deazaguanine synthase [Acidimicrobiales bacterium]|nr:7-cyano-7-deazaguanine synthase [Acidimicrobiales bacterium]
MAAEELEELVVLASGGADSAILVAHLAGRGHVVHPVYVRLGLAWEEVEEVYLRQFLAAAPSDLAIRPLVVLALPIADVYGAHWSVSGDGTPDETTPDEAVYLPGRNLLLLAKTTVWCALHGVRRIALGTLRGNPFADSGREFLSGFAGSAGLALGHELEVITPFADMTKAEVLALGRDLPLDLTFSCIAPVGMGHCQSCNKCAERRKAFADAGIQDGAWSVPG